MRINNLFLGLFMGIIIIIIIIIISGCIVESNPASIETTPKIEYVYITPQPTPVPTMLKYNWDMEFFRTYGSNSEYYFNFENTGNIDLNNVKLKFEFYTNSQNYYTDRKFDIGDVYSGRKVEKIISFPNRFYGSETWSTMKMFISYNNLPYIEEKTKNRGE
jgi:hypothetical protein